MVSIMPGMENFAPERTLTSSGFSPLPSFWPCSSSSFLSAASIWRSTSAETPLVRMYSRQASVWMVKPGGTGRPALVISARPAPLPPRSSFILPLPSALPPPKEKTYLVRGILVRGLNAGFGESLRRHNECSSFIVSKILWILCLRSRSRRNRQGWRILLTRFAEAPNGLRGCARLRP